MKQIFLQRTNTAICQLVSKSDNLADLVWMDRWSCCPKTVASLEVDSLLYFLLLKILFRWMLSLYGREQTNAKLVTLLHNVLKIIYSDYRVDKLEGAKKEFWQDPYCECHAVLTNLGKIESFDLTGRLESKLLIQNLWRSSDTEKGLSLRPWFTLDDWFFTGR